MKIDAIKLAKSVRHNMTGDGFLFDEDGIQRFADLVLEEAAKACDEVGDRCVDDYEAGGAYLCRDAIREMKSE